MITLPHSVRDSFTANHIMRYSMEQLLLVFLCVMMVRVCHFMPGNLLIIINNNNYFYFIKLFSLIRINIAIIFCDRVWVRFGDPDHDRVLRTETWSGAKTTWSS